MASLLEEGADENGHFLVITSLQGDAACWHCGAKRGSAALKKPCKRKR